MTTEATDSDTHPKGYLAETEVSHGHIYTGLQEMALHSIPCIINMLSSSIKRETEVLLKFNSSFKYKMRLSKNSTDEKFCCPSFRKKTMLHFNLQRNLGLSTHQKAHNQTLELFQSKDAYAQNSRGKIYHLSKMVL